MIVEKNVSKMREVCEKLFGICFAYQTEED